MTVNAVWPILDKQPLLQATLAVTRVISRPTYGTLSFLGHVMTNDTTAPNQGSHSLEAFFQAQQVDVNIRLKEKADF